MAEREIGQTEEEKVQGKEQGEGVGQAQRKRVVYRQEAGQYAIIRAVRRLLTVQRRPRAKGSSQSKVV
jgi:hypothetical protein